MQTPCDGTHGKAAVLHSVGSIINKAWPGRGVAIRVTAPGSVVLLRTSLVCVEAQQTLDPAGSLKSKVVEKLYAL